MSISGQALVFVVRTPGWSPIMRAGALTYIAFFAAQVGHTCPASSSRTMPIMTDSPSFRSTPLSNSALLVHSSEHHGTGQRKSPLLGAAHAMLGQVRKRHMRTL